MHRTTMIGASVQLNWTGTAVALHGIATAGSYSTSIDGGSSTISGSGTPSTGGVLFSYSGLDYGSHYITLNVIQSAPVSLTSAEITVGMASGCERFYIFLKANLHPQGFVV